MIAELITETVQQEETDMKRYITFISCFIVLCGLLGCTDERWLENGGTAENAGGLPIEFVMDFAPITPSSRADAQIGEKTELALAPLAVLPEYQRKGIGKSLIQEGHRIAQQLNYDYSIVLGSPDYYTKFGYVPASQYQITAPFPVEDEFFMALKLNAKADAVNGVVEYDPAFGIC